MASLDRLRDSEQTLASAAEFVGVPVDDLLQGLGRRLDELGELRRRIDDLRRGAALGRADDLAADATDGLVVAEVPDIDRDSLRDLAVAVRDHDGVRAVVLGTVPAGGGVAMVAAVAADSALDAGALLADAAKTIGGGGRPNPDLTVVGGKSPEHLAEALEQARAAALAG